MGRPTTNGEGDPDVIPLWPDRAAPAPRPLLPPELVLLGRAALPHLIGFLAPMALLATGVGLLALLLALVARACGAAWSPTGLATGAALWTLLGAGGVSLLRAGIRLARAQW